ncbi:MAG: DUF4355 domain-containing protein [Eubacteriaceae bacterium]|nr:DUF4355 domain-containing protein [Eubacteriaceae bacterium]
MLKDKLIKMNLQLFADDAGADVGNEQATDNTETTETAKTVETDEIKTFTQAEIDAEADRRVSKALETAKTKWAAEEAEKVKQAAELAKLSGEQLAAKQLELKEQDIAKRESELSKQILSMQTKEDLIKKNLPVDFAGMCVAETPEKTLENINALETAWKAAIEKGIDERIKGSAGTPPGAGSLTPGVSAGASYAQRYNVNVVPKTK